jgi:hypothetical protein
MRVSAMYYRKPKVLMPLMLLVGAVVTFPAVADNLTNDNGTYFKGPMATCLSRAKVVYPCVSLSPPAYQANSTFFSNAAPLGANLPLASDEHESGWLAKLRDGEFWNPKGLFSENMPGMDMNFSVKSSGAGMNMNLGPMKFNMYVDESHLSESQFFLGFDRSW